MAGPASEARSTAPVLAGRSRARSSKHAFGPTSNGSSLGRVNELHAFETARTTVEARYLDGLAADFPAACRAWVEQRTRSETQAVIALRLAELDGAEPLPPDDQAAFDARVTTLTADFVEPSRSKAFDEVGDGRRALAVAVRWLRPKLFGDEPS